MTTARKNVDRDFARWPDTWGMPRVRTTAFFMAMVCCALVKTCQADVAVWHQWEQTLSSSRSYANPYQQVTLSVTYAGPNGQKIKGCGFWDGGNTFKIRCMFSIPGTWTWTTICNHTDDAGLHSQTGTIAVTPYSGDNVLYSKGYLKISSNRRYLTYADGDPFLWLGDTAWSAINTMADDDWQLYVDYRVRQKFNVAQMVCGTGWAVQSEDRSGNAPWEALLKSLLQKAILKPLRACSMNFANKSTTGTRRSNGKSGR